MPASPQPAAARRYDRTSRQAAAVANRRRVLDAAGELMLEQGYLATTIKQVATRACVSPEMIYRAFGSKRELVKRLYDTTIAGDDDDVPLGERAQIQQALGAPSLTSALWLYSEFVATYHQRASQLSKLLAEADAEIAGLRRETEQERLRGVTAFVSRLAERGLRDPGIEAQSVAQACWTLTSPAVYHQLVGQCGWTIESYRGWLQRMMTATIS